MEKQNNFLRNVIVLICLMIFTTYQINSNCQAMNGGLSPSVQNYIDENIDGFSPQCSMQPLS